MHVPATCSIHEYPWFMITSLRLHTLNPCNCSETRDFQVLLGYRKPFEISPSPPGHDILQGGWASTHLDDIIPYFTVAKLVYYGDYRGVLNFPNSKWYCHRAIKYIRIDLIKSYFYVLCWLLPIKEETMQGGWELLRGLIYLVGGPYII